MLGASVYAVAVLWLAGGRAKADTFEAFLQGLWPSAQAAGVSRETFDAAIAGLAPDPSVSAKPRAQSEFTISIPAYLAGSVTNGRVARGRAVAAELAGPLGRAQSRHGVPSEIVVAILGVESNFGTAAGGSDALRVLASLA
ncbi:MAG: peptidoglycan-binding protein, partial [Methylocystis sp.]